MATHSIATRIRMRREKVGYTQRELAKRCKINFVTMWRYEQGHMAPSSRTLPRIAQALGVSTDWLCTGRERPTAA